MTRDSDLLLFCRSVIDAARQEHGDRLVIEPGLASNPRLLYTETHYALAALLLFLLDMQDESLLDLAESRLRLWNQGKVPLTFFNSMAICLAAIVLKRSARGHDGLQSILEELVASTPDRHRDVAYHQYCGNNAYLQQVVVDTVLLPLARGEGVAQGGLDQLLAEFRKYRTTEGFFFDLPRHGTAQEPLHPPTYILKILFLVGVCHTLHPSEELAELFRAGVSSTLPLLTREGNFSYFGRTDNSPFAAGLTIFDLRKATHLCADRRHEFDRACASAERFYRTFPRTPSGMLQCNRFAGASSSSELAYSRDDYAYVGQYSLSSCAYALLAAHWFPAATPQVPAASDAERTAKGSVAQSKDLGVLKLAREDHELLLRTGSQVTSWDRRYLGPTVLRYQIGGQLLIGAVPRTISTDDRAAQRSRPESRVQRVAELLQRRFVRGIEQLDGASVGFLPVVRHGTVDYLPYTPLSIDVTPRLVKARYRMVQLSARGLHPCFIELSEFLHRNLPGLKVKHYSRPRFRPADAFELTREVHLGPEGCQINDCISGVLEGKTLLFSARHFPCASIRVHGLSKREAMACWGSDGLQTLELYEARLTGSQARYECRVELNPRPAQPAS